MDTTALLSTPNTTEVPEHEDVPQGVQITLEVTIILVMAVGIPGNLVTLVTVIKHQSLHTSGTVLIGALSLSDAMYYATVLPFRLALLLGAWPVAEGPNYWSCTVSAGLAHWIFGVSMSCMSCIAFNRYTHVLRPNLYKRLFSKKGLIIQLGAMCLLVGILTCIFPWAGIWGEYEYYPHILSCTFTHNTNPSYKYTVLGTGLAIPCVFIITCYSLIYCKVRTSQKRLQSWTKSKPNKVIPEAKSGHDVARGGNNVAENVTKNNATGNDGTARNNVTTGNTLTRQQNGLAPVEQNDHDTHKPGDHVTNNPKGRKISLISFHKSPQTTLTAKQEKQRRASMRMTAMMVMTFTVFFVFMFPYLIQGMVDPESENATAYLMTLMLTWLNGCCNPVIYVAMNGQFRRATKMIFTCGRQRPGEQTIGPDLSITQK